LAKVLPAFVWAVGSSPWVLILREFHQAFDRNLPAAAAGRNPGRIKYSKRNWMVRNIWVDDNGKMAI